MKTEDKKEVTLKPLVSSVSPAAEEQPKDPEVVMWVPDQTSVRESNHGASPNGTQ